MNTGQKYTTLNTIATAQNTFEQTAAQECNEAICNLFARVSPSFANSILFNLQQGFLKTNFFNEVDCLEETNTLFNALECFFRTYNRPENREYIKDLTDEVFGDKLITAL
ncbi:hypothetical protein [Spirosoma sp. KNUC1025]|uniref:hypothetical protein n=1 Tax=Spirosoma sp. KNUC1025 TaxID=2894082 RepID=UPI003870B6B3|nr:hypothetical protein LN737_04485 [Spirosoma sp. KNUC1025]